MITGSIGSETRGQWGAQFYVLPQGPVWTCYATGNSTSYGVSYDLRRRLQSLQNAAERFITGARKYDHISPVLRVLHRLPLRQRIIFKIADSMHQCLNG